MKLSTALILWLAVQTECIRMRVKMNNSNITAHGMFPVEAQAMWRKKMLERTSGCERAFILFQDACWTEARKIPSDRADVRARWQSLVDRRVPSERRKIAKRSFLFRESISLSCSDMVSTFSSGKRDDDFRNPLDNVAIPIGTTTTACSEPSGWTGRMNKAPGFHPFLKDNQHICILHHGDKDRSAARQQASIFGVAMEEAKCLEACDKNIQKAAWNIGSRAYAKYHTAARYFPIFVGPNFGIGRAGKNTVLYMHELGSIIRHHRSNKLRLEFMNFSPIDCSGLRETPISFLHSDFGSRLPVSVAVGTAAGAYTFMKPQLKVVDCHCQVPCGIFDDPIRVAQLKEDAATIRKAMVQIKALTASGHASAQEINQATRWIMTKEEHAAKIIETVSTYMLCQRVKQELFKSKADYLQALEVHHALMQAAMKAKQTVDDSACDVLDHALSDVAPMYTKS